MLRSNAGEAGASGSRTAGFGVRPRRDGPSIFDAPVLRPSQSGDRAALVEVIAEAPQVAFCPALHVDLVDARQEIGRADQGVGRRCTGSARG